MESIKYYSEDDLACKSELDLIIENIKNDEYKCINTINDLFVFFNTIKYLNIERFANYLDKELVVNSKEIIKHLNKEIGTFLNLNKSRITLMFSDIENIYLDDYFEILENYRLFEGISHEDFSTLTQCENFFVFTVLEFDKITKHFDVILKDVLLSDPIYVESILNKYLRESLIHLPPSLKVKDVIYLIESYIDSDSPNINYLGKIVSFPSNIELKISEKTKLRARNREKIELDKLIESGYRYEQSIKFSCEPDLDESIKFKYENFNTEIKLNLTWINENLDYPTLWNNFIYLLALIDFQGRLLNVSKKNSISPLESLFTDMGKHLFRLTRAFKYNEILFTTVVRGYIKTLQNLGINIEDMVKWFFYHYLRDEFFIDNFEIYTPSLSNSFFEKCRVILPEFDKLFKQYNCLIENGSIDQELIQVSSFSFAMNQIKSLNSKKYVYPINDWIDNVSYLLFSDQSKIFYIKEFNGKYKNFFELITHEKVGTSHFKAYQLRKINYLLNENVILEDIYGNFRIKDWHLLIILKEFYYEDVISYWHLSEELRNTIDSLYNENKIIFEDTLFTRNEQDFFDYYMNRSKFSNSLDIRNRYLHGTNTADEEQHESNYYAILKLLIISVLKINDDLIIKNDFNKS